MIGWIAYSVFWAASFFALFWGIEKEKRDYSYLFFLAPVLGLSLGVSIILSPAFGLACSGAIAVFDYYVSTAISHAVRMKNICHTG